MDFLLKGDSNGFADFGRSGIAGNEGKGIGVAALVASSHSKERTMNMADFCVFIAFLGMQVAFTHSELWYEHRSEQLKKHLKHCGWLIWTIHPHTLHSFHDFGIFVIGRLAGG